MTPTTTDAIGALMVARDYVIRNGFAQDKLGAHEYIGSQPDPVQYVLDLCVIPDYRISFPDTSKNREYLHLEMQRASIVQS